MDLLILLWRIKRMFDRITNTEFRFNLQLPKENCIGSEYVQQFQIIFQEYIFTNLT